MNKAAVAVIAGAFASTVAAADITGAGATFPYPIYAKWADAYKKETGVGLNYQSIGSGGGIKQITAKTVDFGASDAPLKPEALEKHGLVQFPAIMGGVVPVYNVKGIAAGQIRITGPVLADIYLGKVKKWNEPALAKLNPGVKLPDQAISVVHRSDGSGTTFLFTNYLSTVSPDGTSTVGEGTAVSWPTGVGGKGNEGVANYVARINSSIGYVEYAYAKQNKLAHAQMSNREGQFVNPSEETFKGKAYPMVVHLVHKSDDGKLAVVAVMLKQGKPNAALKPVFDAMPKSEGGKHALAASFDPAALLPAKRGYYKFMGSLTTPPCSEGVRWQVLKEPIEVSKAQIAAFQSLYKHNARPVQPLNGRKIEAS